MKVKIKNTAVSKYGETAIDKVQQKYADALSHIAGTLVEVETKHVFEDQFNLVPTPGSENGLRVMMDLVDGVEWAEGESYEWYKNKVKERYAKDWPGRSPNFYLFDDMMYKAGMLPVDPTIQAYVRRGYDSCGETIIVPMTLEDFSGKVDVTGYTLMFKTVEIHKLEHPFASNEEAFEQVKQLVDEIIEFGDEHVCYEKIKDIYLSL